MKLKLVLAIALAFGPGITEARENRQRIVLQPGWKETIVSGRISALADTMVYILRLRTGQHLSVELELGPTLRAFVLLKPPAGNQIGPGAKIDSIVNQSGMFQIRVIPLEQSSGTFRLHLRLHKYRNDSHSIHLPFIAHGANQAIEVDTERSSRHVTRVLDWAVSEGNSPCRRGSAGLQGALRGPERT
jgi:hypothetical protein